MSKLTIPAGYKTPLSTYEMQRAIEFIKSNFQVNLGQALNLRRVSAPLFVEENSGLNDNLNGVERPVSFDIPDVGATGQVVHSLAKWKRLALKRYDFKPGKGLGRRRLHLTHLDFRFCFALTMKNDSSRLIRWSSAKALQPRSNT